jgi:hypothetical protein
VPDSSDEALLVLAPLEKVAPHASAAEGARILRTTVSFAVAADLA